MDNLNHTQPSSSPDLVKAHNNLDTIVDLDDPPESFASFCRGVRNSFTNEDVVDMDEKSNIKAMDMGLGSLISPTSDSANSARKRTSDSSSDGDPSPNKAKR